VRVGVFGGTFDPPHVGHLIAVADAAEALALEQVIVIPAAAHPLKRDAVAATPSQRLDMVRLTVADDPRLTVDAIEIDRPGLSFTVETLRELARRSPADQRFLIVGADVVESFAQWREPLAIMGLAQLAILRRGEVETDALAGCLPRDAQGRTPAYRVVASRRVDISSSEVRARVRAGRSIHGFVPEAVRAYIDRFGLYRGGSD
jgi:nicotinate-nucleotide adenylyltransferase